MSQNVLETSPSQTAAQSSEKFLTFKLHDEFYGVGVLKVREILRVQKITPVPKMQAHVKGVFNLRGKVIPVIDLRIKFDLEAGPTTERTCIVVVNLDLGDNQDSLIGLIVDAVDEVVQIAREDIEDAPATDNTWLPAECIQGLVRIKGSIKTLLNIESVVSHRAS